MIQRIFARPDPLTQERLERLFGSQPSDRALIGSGERTSRRMTRHLTRLKTRAA